MLKPSGFLLPPLSGGSLVDGVVSSEELVGRRRLYREELSSMLPSPPSTWSSPGLGGKWLGAHWNPLCPREGAHSCGGGCHHCRCRRRRCCCCRRHWTNFTSTYSEKHQGSQHNLNGKKHSSYPKLSSYLPTSPGTQPLLTSYLVPRGLACLPRWSTSVLPSLDPKSP